VVRTSGFHPGNRGSIPLWTTTFKHNKTLLSAYNYHVSSIEGFFVNYLAYNTIRGYKASFSSLLRYLNGTDIKLSRLDNKFIEGYFNYLRNTEGLRPNSAYKNIKHLNRVIKVAILNKWLITNLFKEFHCHYRNPIRPYLTDSEINRQYVQVFTTDRLTKVRGLFLYQVYTGLSYADMIFASIFLL
jgi:site-specific recombinase XerD